MLKDFKTLVLITASLGGLGLAAGCKPVTVSGAEDQERSVAQQQARAPAASQLPADELALILELDGSRTLLRSVKLNALDTLKPGALREKTPWDGGRALWKGASLSAVLESAIEKLPSEEKARIDLVVLRNGQGEQALLPRHFLVKYSAILASQRNGTQLAKEQGPLALVVPTKLKASRSGNDPLPLEKFFLPGVREVAFTSYREQYGEFRLKRRTDPAAMRGERLFVQSCAACHQAGSGPALEKIMERSQPIAGRRVANAGHSAVKGLPAFTSRDWRAFNNYVKAWKFESSQLAQARAVGAATSN